MTHTRRLTMAQALVEFLTQQHTSLDGVEQPFFGGVFDDLRPRQRGRRRPGAPAGEGPAAAATCRGTSRRWSTRRSASPRWPTGAGRWPAPARSGPGATNMMTGAALATINRLPVLLLPGDIFATRGPAPVLQQLELTGARRTRRSTTASSRSRNTGIGSTGPSS